ncbi:MAG: branched-chain amino acid ABC transporter permease [Sulfurifustaceae bacterium]
MNDTSPVVASSVLTAPRARGLAKYKFWFAAAVVLVILPHLPGLNGSFGQSLLSQMGIAAVFALSFNMLFGQTGLLSFGHAVYFGLGGYMAIHFMRAINAGLPVPMMLAPLAGALGGLLFAIVFGSLTTKKAGTIFALITLGIGELVHSATLMLPSFFGGEEGVTANRTAGLKLFGLTLGPQIQVYYVIVFWALVAAAFMYAFTRTPVGRMCNAVRDNPERAEFVGYNPRYVRFIAFCVAGLFAGLAGGLHAINYEIVAADAVSAGRSGTVLIMAYIGGVGHFIGPILGAITLTWLQISLSDYTVAWVLYLGLFFMVIILFAPGGLAGLVMMHAPIVRTKALWSVLRSYLIALPPALVMFVGAVLLIEMSYRLSTQAELGTTMRIFWVGFDAATAVPWIGALILVVGGFFLFRMTWPVVSRAWHRALDEAKAGAAEGEQDE